MVRKWEDIPGREIAKIGLCRCYGILKYKPDNDFIRSIFLAIRAEPERYPTPRQSAAIWREFYVTMKRYEPHLFAKCELQEVA